MNPLSIDLWQRGLLYKDYRRTVRRNGKTFDEVFREPTHEAEDLAFLRQLPPLRALAESLGGRPFSKLEPEERKKVSEAFEEGYRREFRRANFDEILTLLRAFFHLPAQGGAAPAVETADEVAV